MFAEVKKLQEAGVFGHCKVCHKDLHDPNVDPIWTKECDECEGYKPKRRNRNTLNSLFRSVFWVVLFFFQQRQVGF